MINLQKCLEVCSLSEAALIVANKVAFDKSKGFVLSHDNQSYWEFASSINIRVARLTRNISKYVFQPTLKKTRRIKWKERILYISTWEDKIVETWLNKSLNRLLSQWFSHKSYAYRIDGIGIDTCQQSVISNIKQCSYIARRDVKSFFYTVDHQILLDKLTHIIEPNDYLFDLLRQRIQFQYIENQSEPQPATLGLPFGSPIACLLANIYLTDLDRSLLKQHVHYYRYADDFLIAADSADAVLEGAKKLENELDLLKLQLNTKKTENLSFVEHTDFQLVNRFRFLGLEYWPEGIVRLPIEKKRKIINIIRRTINSCPRHQDQDTRLRLIIENIQEAVLKRIRYAAIIDYYLKHVNDEAQLRVMDREIAELVISAALGKPFRPRDFKIISYKKLRELGLISLVHRNRLHQQGHLQVPFLSIFNTILFERYQKSIERRTDRFNQIKLSRKLRLASHSN